MGISNLVRNFFWSWPFTKIANQRLKTCLCQKSLITVCGQQNWPLLFTIVFIFQSISCSNLWSKSLPNWTLRYVFVPFCNPTRLLENNHCFDNNMTNIKKIEKVTMGQCERLCLCSSNLQNTCSKCLLNASIVLISLEVILFFCVPEKCVCFCVEVCLYGLDVP